MTPGTMVLRNGETGEWLLFRNPRRVIRADRLAEVLPALAELESAVARGQYAAGVVSYEASSACDDALVTHPAGAWPLLWFGLYNAPVVLAAPPHLAAEPIPPLAWAPDTEYPAYADAIARIKDYIARGHTYQVNYTLRLRAPFAGDPYALFAALCRAQRVPYSAYVDIGAQALCSASPELFFRLAGEEIRCRPMKGTAPRGRTLAEDQAQARWLRASEKNRAENVMIVDMIRNDLGRIAHPGSVRVSHLYDVEQYATVWQMTSTVTARTTAPIGELFRALFPCASITGAPKVRTMAIINELEQSPRGAYTGCIGYLAPGRQAQFNVAIRTIAVDRARQQAEYGVGGGIVWDSVDREEYAECAAKARVLFADRPTVELLETLRWQPGKGYYLLRRHLARLAESARYFGIPVEPAAVRARLLEAAAGFPRRRQRVRLLLAEDGTITIESAPLAATRQPWRVALARQPIDPQERDLYHKTTHRARYQVAKADFPAHDDVLLWNTAGELTESTIANLVVRHGGVCYTPPLTSGLLPGTLRAHLLARGVLHEKVLTRADLATAEAVYLINSLRGWIRVHVEED